MCCTKHVPVLLCTTKLAKGISQYYFVLQSLHKLLPSTDVYYRGLHKPPTPQYYFVLQSLHKLPRSTTLYYKACTKHFPVLLCAIKLAQSTSQYYFVLQSLHKALPSTTVYYKSLHKLLPSTTLYYKACTKHFPVLFCTTKLEQTTFTLHTCT